MKKTKLINFMVRNKKMECIGYVLNTASKEEADLIAIRATLNDYDNVISMEGLSVPVMFSKCFMDANTLSSISKPSTFTIDDAKEVITAWESLPGGRSYSGKEIENWLAKNMQPVISKLRAKIK